MTRFIVRQGDVLIFAAEIPNDTCVVDRDGRGRIILAEGEATGHAHAILDRGAELLSVADQADRWLRVGVGGATLVHDEHGAIALPPGDYQVRTQRQYTPERIIRVAD